MKSSKTKRNVIPAKAEIYKIFRWIPAFAGMTMVGILILSVIKSSVVFQKKDRWNVVFYGKNTVFYSLGFDDVSYQLRFPSDTVILVPGGYGYYRVGALGKLAALEKKPEIFKKTISTATSSFIDLYFYPKKEEIYYDSSAAKAWPSFSEILVNKSNGTLIDRLYLTLFFLTKRPSQNKIISDLPVKLERDKKIFDQEEFFKTNLGFFYKKTYRNERVNVQIIYTKSYQTAKFLSQILEGEGIKVVDISQKEIDINKRCLLLSSEKNLSKTTRDLQKFFGCSLKKGETEVSNIILELGSLEKEWAVE